MLATLFVVTILAQAPAVDFESPAGAYAQAAMNLDKNVAPGDRLFMRYLSLYSVPPEDRVKCCNAIGFWVNSLTTRHEPVPIVLVANDTLVRINIADLGWDRESRKERLEQYKAAGVEVAAGTFSEDPWEALAAKDPYFFSNDYEVKKITKYKVQAVTKTNAQNQQYTENTNVPYTEEVRELRRGWVDPGMFDYCQKVTYSLKCVLRADWFLVHTSADAPVGCYDDFMMLPKKEADLYKTLLIDEKNVRLQSLSIGGATKAGSSYVANGTRELELIRGESGELWRTYDFDAKKLANDKEGKKNPRRRFRGTVEHDGREVIWELPMGTHAYALFNGAGDRVAEVPPDIAQDRRRPSPEAIVKNAWKCVSCHSQESGIIPYQDVIQLQMQAPDSGLLIRGANPYAVAREKRKMEDYYSKSYRGRIQDQRSRYAERIKSLNGMTAEANGNNFVRQIETYVYGTVGRAQAAREFGIDPENLNQFLKSSNQSDLLFLVNNEPITRAEFELAFRDGMLGVKAYPWELVKKEPPK